MNLKNVEYLMMLNRFYRIVSLRDESSVYLLESFCLFCIFSIVNYFHFILANLHITNSFIVLFNVIVMTSIFL